MPLVRVEVRNEYALGAPELYREAKKEDPKEILEGVAVSGLVGVLRQLGDLAEFAAEVFHGLQEEVMITSSRSHKLMARVQRIEAALSPLEKALLAQRSHLHFAYTAGSNWHARIRCDQNHFIYSDVPQFIADSYENSRDPPCLHMLDRFDPGGPGSCLKRYSDPTFFQRASVASGEASSDKISKDKKSRKIKKRRSWTRNGEVSRDASFSYNSVRMQFTQLNIGEHTSPSQTASTYDATVRSDLGEQSNLDLRNCSGYTDGDSRLSYSVQPEEQESRESISSQVKGHGDYLDYNFLEEKIRDAYDDIEINLSQEHGGSSLSSVTWDEKREALDHTKRDSDEMTQDGHSKQLESLAPNRDLESPHDDAVDIETVDKMDVLPCNQTGPALEFGDDHLDDMESETDHFMDALNTIESEAETDIDCTKTQKVEQCYKLDDRGADNGERELIRHNMECQSSNYESNVLSNTIGSEDYSKLNDKVVDYGACELIRHNVERQSPIVEPDVLFNSSLINGSDGHNLVPMSPKSSTSHSINEVTAKDDIKAISLADKHLLSSQHAGDLSSLVSPQSVSSCENGDAGKHIESISSPASSKYRDSGPGMSTTDRRNSAESQTHAPETSNVAPFTFWTNGGLLGLQPSKPPDWSVSNARPQDPVHKKDAGEQGPTENLKNTTQCHDMDSSRCHEYQESGASFRKTSWKISPADLDIKLGKLGGSLYDCNANSTGSGVKAPGTFLPVNSTFQAESKHQENGRISSRMSELSNRFIPNGSNKKLLPGSDGNSFAAGFQNADTFEQKNRSGTFSGRSKDLFAGESPVLSPSSSPPLKHMKISFQPIDGFETSKLRLKFPDGNTNTESGSDIFPSFQLVPEVSFTRNNVDSDSDADTFYRSSPSVSDDCRSNQSESNSDQWESSESPTSKERDLYDSLRRISLTESVSTVQEKGRTNHEVIHDSCGLQLSFIENDMQNPESCGSSDVQSLSTINHSFRTELRSDTTRKDLLEPQFVPSPAPPPLPPVQWRGMSSHPDGIEDKSEAMPEGSYYAFDLMHSSSTVSQPKPAPFSEDQIGTTNIQKIKSSLQKSRVANQGKCIDQKDDFLQQIRKKSFNLRPTMTAKPSVVPSGASATVQVTAILEKANAIRQAVGSDGEDDGNWSDT